MPGQGFAGSPSHLRVGRWSRVAAAAKHKGKTGNKWFNDKKTKQKKTEEKEEEQPPAGDMVVQLKK